MTEKQAEEIINLLYKINNKLDEINDVVSTERHNAESLDEIKSIIRTIRDK